MQPEAQSGSVRRAQVEFHNFASLGEPERAIRVYAEENQRRGSVLHNHRRFIGEMTPYLEIGANAGHTSYMLSNEFGADGFALDISADALRHGIALMDRWKLAKAPVRVAGDALNLPFRDGSLRFVMTYQTLSQFMDIEKVFLEVKRVLTPGGVFLLAEEPLLRKLSLRLYRAPYWELMKPWERKLYQWGLLGYLVRDVIGAAQEENFGIRQNHSMYLGDWHRLIRKHFVAQEYEIFVPERGWGERWMKRLGVRLDPYGSVWRSAHLLGGTLAAVCRKAGDPPELAPDTDQFETFLRCPDCHQSLAREAPDTLRCACGYSAANEGGVYNLLPARERLELYPGDRDDIVDFSIPGHEAKLLGGFHELEGVYGGKYRWMGAGAARVRLKRVGEGPRRLRVRGHVTDGSFKQGSLPQIRATANGEALPAMTLDRTGIFVYEADVPDADEYRIELNASPAWSAPPDERRFTVIIGMVRLVPRDAEL